MASRITVKRIGHKLHFVLLMALIGIGAACGGGGSPTPTPTKSALRGLLDLGDISFYTNSSSAIPINDPDELQPFASSFTGIVINATWAQLQPIGDTPLADDNPIDQALQAVRNYNSANRSNPLLVKLRVWGGLTAPDWVKAQAVCGQTEGAINVTYIDQNDQQETGTVGAWWTPTYIREWRRLQALLARKYDSDRLIQEVAATSCASSTDEPIIAWNRGEFMENGAPQTTINQLQQCGYSDQAQQACLAGAIEDYSAWVNTPLDFPFSIYVVTDADVPPTPKLSTDPAFTATLMEACAAAGHCILSNQALRNPLYSPDQIVYTTMVQLYPKAAIDFQTASPANIMDWCGAVGDGVTLHASSLEMWGDFGGFLTLPDGVAIMANLSAAVLNHTQPAPSPCPPITTRIPSPSPTPAA